MSVLEKLGMIFYVVDRNATTFERPEEVPKYINEALPVLFMLVVVEWVVNLATGRGRVRTGDVLTSAGHGLLYETSKLTFVWTELCLYDWVYQRRLIDLDWSAPVTWWVAAIGADFAFYWYHRATHEVNLAWAAHQVHHSSQDYNLSGLTAVSVPEALLPAGVHPLALLGVPLPAVIVHIQLSLLYQFWIHTEMIDSLGPLEWVLNTPSHHRVHHGANKWCLDKNYAGVLIIWDRLFGTFEAERRGKKEGKEGKRGKEQIAYGLVDQPQAYNTLWLQLFYYKAVFEKALSMETWGDFFKALFYGPGWSPGSPRLGDPATFTDVQASRPLYNPRPGLWQEIYLVVQYIITLLVQQLLVMNYASVSWAEAGILMAFVVATLVLIGAIYDGWEWAEWLDVARCIAFVFYAYTHAITPWPALDLALSLCLALSALHQSYRALTRPTKAPKRTKAH